MRAQTIQPIHVVIAANRAHRAGLLNVVASAVNATGVDAERLRFLLLAPKGEGEGLAQEAFCAARRRGRVVAREFSPQLINNPEALSANSRLAEPLNYARFFVDRLLPADAETAIYLDSDVTVRASLANRGIAQRTLGDVPYTWKRSRRRRRRLHVSKTDPKRPQKGLRITN